MLLEAGCVRTQGPTAELLTRLDLSLAHGDMAGAVLQCQVVSHDAYDHLTLVRFAGGELTVTRQSTAPGESLRVRVAARDVSLTLQRQNDTSILNILSCTVIAVSPDGPGQVMVALQAGDTPLLARITARSSQALGLVPGKAVFAQVKGVAVLG